jgi:1-acyl-sn-glycerol-3-phosphate acyltransferase
MKQIALLKTRRFAPFFVTQFLGAFNDNLYKNALVVLLTFQAVRWTTLAPEILTNLAAGIFILPFFLFSATAGQLADKYDKAWLARLLKILEIVILGVAALGFFAHSLPLLLAALFLLGLQSALFGPVKYSILPQHLHEDELVGGNALVEAGTFVAILIGTLAGGLLAAVVAQPWWIAAAGFLVAVAGYGASRRIPPAPAPEPSLVVNLNPFSETWRNIGFARHNRSVFLAILGISWFWLCGALYLAQFPVFAKNILGGDEMSVTLLLAVFTVGIGLGSMLCEKLSGKHVEVGLIPFGAIGMAVFGLDLALASPEAVPSGAPLALTALLGMPAIWRVCADLMALGVFGGFFVVPLYVLIQTKSDIAHRARIIAANNILNALFMVVGALTAAGLLAGGLSIPQLFLIAAGGSAVVAVLGYYADKPMALRFLAWLLIGASYRLRKSGFEHVPESGPAVLVCNHVSFVDSIVIMAAVRRPIRFVMDHSIYQAPAFGFLFRHSRTIPIATAKEDPALKEAAFAEVAQALRNGELIGLFPEGRITRTGEINHFRYGVGRIVAETPVPVIPMALRGLWGSFFSRRYGPAMSKPSLLRPLARIELAVGKAIPPAQGTPENLQEIVTRLRGDLL